MKPSTGTLVRVALLIVALANMLVATLGIVPEEVVGDTQAYAVASAVITAVVGIVNSWKNNSFTTEAIEADEYLQELRIKKKLGPEVDFDE